MPKYVIDEVGNKYESMTKDEILASIGAGGEREHILTGEINYDSDGDGITDEVIDYAYAGEKPSDDIILKLLQTGLKPTENNLTSIEISDIINLSGFTIHYYYKDGELYVSNRANKSILLFKEGIGIMRLYPDIKKRKLEYYVKSSNKINNIVWCTQYEYNNIVKDENTTYIVEDEEYSQNIVITASYDSENKRIFLINFDINTLSDTDLDKYILHLISDENSEIDINYYIPLTQYNLSTINNNEASEKEAYEQFIFKNDIYTITISKCEDEHENDISIADTPRTADLAIKAITANTANTATKANTADIATNATNADNATTADAATKVANPQSLTISNSGCVISKPGLYAIEVGRSDDNDVSKNWRYTALMSIPDLTGHYEALYGADYITNEHYHIMNKLKYNSTTKTISITSEEKAMTGTSEVIDQNRVIKSVKLIAEY